MIAGDPAIRRRWLVGSAMFAATWFILLWPLADSLFGPVGGAPTNDMQANRLIYEELVKLVLLTAVAGLAAWLGIRTLLSRSFPPTGLRVPFRMSVNRGTAALLPGIGLLMAGLITLGFRVASLRVTLELATLVRRVS